MSRGGEFIIPVEDLSIFSHVLTVNDLNEEQKLFRESIREFVSSEILSQTEQIEKKDWSLTRQLLDKLGLLGYLGVEVPVKYGGEGLDKVTGLILAEEISKNGSFACTVLADIGIGTLPIVFFGTEEQKQKYLPRIVKGEIVSAYSLTESSAGSDVNSVKAKAVKSEDGKHFIINGKKMFVTNGGFADICVVFAQLEDVGLSAFIVEKSYPGFSVGKEEHKMGIRGSSTAEIILENVKVPVENLLGETGKGFKIAVNILNIGRFKLGAACLGAGRLCLSEAINYANSRKQFGKSLISFGLIRKKIAEMAMLVYAMESVVYRTAGHLEDAIGKVDTNDSKAVLKAIEEFAVECSIVKVFCSEALDKIVDENVQIHGGSGFCDDASERHYRDSRINRIFEGTNEINRLLIVDMLLKKVLRGDLNLIPVSKKIREELFQPKGLQVEPNELTERLLSHLNNVKKLVIFGAGDVAMEKLGPKLGEDLNQEIVGLISDCLINLYVMDSVLAAYLKDKKELSEYYVRCMFSQSLQNLRSMLENLLSSYNEGDELRTKLVVLKRFMKATPENLKELHNKIVDKLLGA